MSSRWPSHGVSSNPKVSQVLQKTAAINSRHNDVRERCMRPLHVDNKGAQTKGEYWI